MSYVIRPLVNGFLIKFYVDTELPSPVLDTTITHVTWHNALLRQERLRFIPDDLIAVLGDELKERGLISM